MTKMKNLDYDFLAHAKNRKFNPLNETVSENDSDRREFNKKPFWKIW